MKTKIVKDRPPDIKTDLTNVLNSDQILTDLRRNKWKVGRKIGNGGFGQIYLVSDKLSGRVNDDAQYVVKIEPFESSSLFVELHFYANAAKKELVDNWMNSHNLSFLGMPYYLGSGSFYRRRRRYRFIILPRYGADLQTALLNHKKCISQRTAFTLSMSIVDVLEYVHNHGYVHSDIKASNLVFDRKNQDNVYLIDFGLAYKIYNDLGKHKQFEADQRAAHDGTIEFTSRDAHIGAHSRRSDLEILGYNVLKWITGVLPWQNCAKVEEIQNMKNQMMNNIPELMKRCFKGKEKAPDALVQYFDYVKSLKFKDKPDYNYCRSLFQSCIEDAEKACDKNISFTNRTSKKRAREKNTDKENENCKTKKVCKLVSPLKDDSCVTLSSNNVRITRNSAPPLEEFDWPAIIRCHPEKLNSPVPVAHSNQNRSFVSEEKETEEEEIEEDNGVDIRGLDNPTDVMKIRMENIIKKNTAASAVFKKYIGLADREKNQESENSCFVNNLELSNEDSFKSFPDSSTVPSDARMIDSTQDSSTSTKSLQATPSTRCLLNQIRMRHRNHLSPLQKSTRYRRNLPIQLTCLSYENKVRQRNHSSPLQKSTKSRKRLHPGRPRTNLSYKNADRSNQCSPLSSPYLRPNISQKKILIQKKCLRVLKEKLCSQKKPDKQKSKSTIQSCLKKNISVKNGRRETPIKRMKLRAWPFARRFPLI